MGHGRLGWRVRGDYCHDDLLLLLFLRRDDCFLGVLVRDISKPGLVSWEGHGGADW